MQQISIQIIGGYQLHRLKAQMKYTYSPHNSRHIGQLGIWPKCYTTFHLISTGLLEYIGSAWIYCLHAIWSHGWIEEPYWAQQLVWIYVNRQCVDKKLTWSGLFYLGGYGELRRWEGLDEEERFEEKDYVSFYVCGFINISRLMINWLNIVKSEQRQLKTINANATHVLVLQTSTS